MGKEFGSTLAASGSKICSSIFRQHQKQSQRSDLILLDILTCRDSAVRKLTLMELGLYPGGYECSILENVNVQKAGDEDTNNNQQVEESTTGHHSTCAGRASRKTINENVTIYRRDRAAIRNEIVPFS